MPLHAHGNDDQVLRYEWNGKLKQCRWSLTATGRFDLETLGQDAAESKAVDEYLCEQRERGLIEAD